MSSAMLAALVSMAMAQLDEVQSLAYLSKQFEETGKVSDIFNMIIGDTNYTFPDNYSSAEKIASVMLSSEQCLEYETLTWGPGGVIILEEPTDPDVYAMLLERYSGIPTNESYAGEIYEQEELDDTVLDTLNELSSPLAKRRNPMGYMCDVNLWGCKRWTNCKITPGGAKDKRCVCGYIGQHYGEKSCYNGK